GCLQLPEPGRVRNRDGPTVTLAVGVDMLPELEAELFGDVSVDGRAGEAKRPATAPRIAQILYGNRKGSVVHDGYHREPLERRTGGRPTPDPPALVHPLRSLDDA